MVKGAWNGPNTDPHYLQLIFPPNALPSLHSLMAHCDEWDLPYPDRGHVYTCAYPSVGGNDRAQHPLMTWYLILFALSILARYHPAAWRRLLNKNETMMATLLERLVQKQAQDAIRLAGGALAKQMAYGA